jgi:hypothetical protein
VVQSNRVYALTPAAPLLPNSTPLTSPLATATMTLNHFLEPLKPLKPMPHSDICSTRYNHITTDSFSANMNPSTPSPDGVWHFFRLPAEVRNMVYEFALSEPAGLVCREAPHITSDLFRFYPSTAAIARSVPPTSSTRSRPLQSSLWAATKHYWK